MTHRGSIGWIVGAAVVLGGTAAASSAEAQQQYQQQQYQQQQYQQQQGQPPPGYGQPPPQQQPRYQQQPPPPQPLPHERRLVRVPYREGMALPPDATLYSRGKPGLWISGIVVLAVSYVVTAVTTASLKSVADDDKDKELNLLYVPVAGPFLYLQHAHDLATAPLIFNGLAQSAGILLGILGGSIRRTYAEYYADSRSPRVWVQPMLGPKTVGLSLRVF